MSANQNHNLHSRRYRNVVDNFAADFSTMAQATGLRSVKKLAPVVSDFRVLSEANVSLTSQFTCSDKEGLKLVYPAIHFPTLQPAGNENGQGIIFGQN